ncbi:3-ketoacyl-ACP reductase [Flavobacterium sp.]|uniref:3-ketoacyl-ACP reductase n=1 Tax=Flavobacterium sp. TaxID=239 RepID=UPI00120BD4CE|nr:3-ketoacyl-ACP reductase [Flavobacterium sp.]RZJ70707.1 MAG: 3-ketoacyl-ACP reductase [Flavobacterium sp.]
MNTLKGKTAIITGGNRGLGKAVALLLAQEGVNIGLTGRNEEQLASVAAEISKIGVKSAYAIFSVDNAQEVKSGIDKLVNELGGVDILVNNAGIGWFGSLEKMPAEDWEQVIKTNLFGVYYTSQAVYPYLKEKGEGDVVNVASTAGLKGGANMSSYAASKAAVISLSQSMMAEWRKNNIRVITLTPSTIATDMSIEGKLTDGNPEKVLQPEDFAEWVRDMLKMNRRALIANGSIFSTNP